MIPIARPQMGEEEKERVWEAMASGSLAQGPRVRELEEAFAAFVGAGHAVATSSGTTALHLALLGYGIGPGDEVITVPFTFIASANSILYTGARPVFVDIGERDFNIDPSLIEAAVTERSKAILPVSLYGQPADMEAVTEIAERRGLAVVEDAAQAHGAAIGERAERNVGRGHVQLLPDQEHDHRRGGHDHHRRRRAGGAGAPPARAWDEGSLPPRRGRLQLPHDRYLRSHRPCAAAEAAGIQRAAPRHRGPVRRGAAWRDHAERRGPASPTSTTSTPCA